MAEVSAAFSRVRHGVVWASEKGIVVPAVALLIALVCWTQFDLEKPYAPVFGLAFWVSLMFAISKFPPLGLPAAIWGIWLVRAGHDESKVGGFFLFLTSAVVAIWRLHQMGKGKVQQSAQHLAPVQPRQRGVPQYQHPHGMPREVDPVQASSNGVSFVRSVGMFLTGLALVAVSYFWTQFDISVAMSDGTRVVNLARMQDRQMGVLVAISVGIVGVLITLFGGRRR